MHRILVVDDEKINRIVVERLLESTYEMHCVASGREALEALKQQNFDLVLLDIRMDGMDGFEVITRIQEDEEIKHVPVIFLTSDRDEKTEEACFLCGAVDFIPKPFSQAVLLQRVRRTLELQDYQKNLQEIVDSQLKRITQLQTDIIISMANLIESRDGTTGEHVRRTSTYLEYLLKRLREENIYQDILTPVYSDYVCKAAPMHDIGKIAVSDLVLQKPGKFTKEEFEMMKQHTVEGGRLIRKNMSVLVDPEFVEIASDMANYHHEWVDGSGYPEGLQGNAIPLAARLMAVVDVFDALTSVRQYKEAIPYDKAVSIMREEAGRHFEQKLVDVFLEKSEELKQLKQSVNG